MDRNASRNNIQTDLEVKPSTHSAGRPDDRHSDKLEQILLVSAQLFAEKGYEATSLQHIADRVGIHKATLYHYVDSKDSILYQCLARSFSDLDDLEAELMGSDLQVMDRLKVFVKHLAVAQNSEFGRCLILIGRRPLGVKSAKKILGFQKRLDKIVRDFIQEGIELGVIRQCSPKLMSAFLFGALNWVPQWYEPKGPLKLDEIMDEFVLLLEEGILNRSK